MGEPRKARDGDKMATAKPLLAEKEEGRKGWGSRDGCPIERGCLLLGGFGGGDDGLLLAVEFGIDAGLQLVTLGTEGAECGVVVGAAGGILDVGDACLVIGELSATLVESVGKDGGQGIESACSSLDAGADATNLVERTRRMALDAVSHIHFGLA